MTDKPSIFEALAAVMDEVKAVGKGSRNSEQNYSFRGIDDVLNAVGPVLRKHRVVVVPEVLEAAYRDVTTSRGKPSREVTVKVRYTFYGPTGDNVSAVTAGESMDFGDKGTAKAMSVAFRIALLQTLSLPTDEPDADSFSPERAYRDETPQEKPAGPTQAQADAFDLAAKEIAACDTLDQLRALWPDIVQRNKDGLIHNSHCDTLLAARDDAARRIKAEAGETP